MTEATLYDKQFYERQKDHSLLSAERILPLVFEWSGQPQRVVDVGCGVGTWLYACQQLGVDEVLGLDGDWVDSTQLYIPEANFRRVDLISPPPLSERFDLALSMEVAEHLPLSSASSFITFLCSLADFVLFSAAVPNQGGTNHLNEQWPDYWAALFAESGFVQLDPIRPIIWRDTEIGDCYRQNVYLYVAQHLVAGDERLQKEANLTRKEDLMLVYRRLARRHATPSIATALKILWQALRRCAVQRGGKAA